MAFGRLFVAFLEAKVGNRPPEVAGEVRLGVHNAPNEQEAHNLLWAWEQIAALLAYIVPPQLTQSSPARRIRHPSVREAAVPFPLPQPGQDRAPPLRVEEQQLVQGGEDDAELGGAQPVADANPRDVRRVHFQVRAL